MIPENRRTAAARMRSNKGRSMLEQAVVLAAGTFALLLFLML